MYVDECGNYTQGRKDGPFYVLSGIIIHELNLSPIEMRVKEYKDTYFRGSYKCAEIHTTDIVNGKGAFEGLDTPTKTLLLDNLYNIILGMPTIIISVCIIKWKMALFPEDWTVLKTAWTYISERFDSFINDSNRRGLSKDKGIIIIDKSSKSPDGVATDVINTLRKQRRSSAQDIRHIVEEPLFISSTISEQMQLADASAYCTCKHFAQNIKFEKYWAQVYNKLRCDPDGNPIGYGLKIFPEE